MFTDLIDGPSLPIGLRNAAPRETQTMRIGIPHRSGKLAFNAFNEELPTMVSAGAFWDRRTLKFRIPEASDLYELDFALDSAGFSAISGWKKSGTQTSGMAGVYPWSVSQYLELVSSVPRAWYSQADLCCEPEIASSPAEVSFRVRATATLLEVLLRQLHEWHLRLVDQGWSAGEIANALPAPVPVLQGWAVADYLESLELMQEVWTRWVPWLEPAPTLIGVGSVCRRSVHHPKYGLLAILDALEDRLPASSQLHCFGVKGAALRHLKMMPSVASYDSMAFDFGARIAAREERVPNTMARRTTAMTQWAAKARLSLAPCAGDQFRLAF
jgi:hypothetical protein